LFFGQFLVAIIIATLGAGASGVVHKATHKTTGLEFAIKDISVIDLHKRDQIIKELQALMASRNPWLVGFYGAFYSEGAISLALEYMNGGSLADILSDVGAVPENVLAIIIYQVLKGLYCLHKERRLVHRDLKVCSMRSAFFRPKR
jgi:serine/threonine protein kinase